MLDVRAMDQIEHTIQDRAERLAEWLRTALRRETLSYQELSERAGVSKATIANLATARRVPDREKPTLPSTDTIRALARGLATDGFGGVSAEKESEYYYLGLVALGCLPADDDEALAEARQLLKAARDEGLPSALRIRPGMGWTKADTATLRMLLQASRKLQQLGLFEAPPPANHTEAAY